MEPRRLRRAVTQLKRSARSEEAVASHKQYLWPSVTITASSRWGPTWRDAALVRTWKAIRIWISRASDPSPWGTAEDFQQGERAGSTGCRTPRRSIPRSTRGAPRDRANHAGNLQGRSFFTSSVTESNEAAILTGEDVHGQFRRVALRHAYSRSATGKAVTDAPPIIARAA